MSVVFHRERREIYLSYYSNSYEHGKAAESFA